MSGAYATNENSKNSNRTSKHQTISKHRTNSNKMLTMRQNPMKLKSTTSSVPAARSVKMAGCVSSTARY